MDTVKLKLECAYRKVCDGVFLQTNSVGAYVCTRQAYCVSMHFSYTSVPEPELAPLIIMKKKSVKHSTILAPPSYVAKNLIG